LGKYSLKKVYAMGKYLSDFKVVCLVLMLSSFNSSYSQTTALYDSLTNDFILKKSSGIVLKTLRLSKIGKHKFILENIIFETSFPFNDIDFVDTVSLNSCSFLNRISFDSSTFNSSLSFVNSDFKDTLSFHGTKFRGILDLNIDSSRYKIDFRNAEFGQGSKIIFGDSILKHDKIEINWYQIKKSDDYIISFKELNFKDFVNTYRRLAKHFLRKKLNKEYDSVLAEYYERKSKLFQSKLSSNTLLMDKEILSLIDNIDTSSIKFHYSEKLNNSIKKNKYLLSCSSTKIPNGTSREIVSKQKQGDYLLVNTKAAQIDSCFDKLYVDTTLYFKKYKIEEGDVDLEFEENIDCSIHIPLNVILSKDLKFMKTIDASTGIQITGYLCITPYCDLTFVAGSFLPKYVDFELGFKEKLNANIIFFTDFGVSREVSLAKLNLPPITIGLLTVVPQLDLVLTLEAKVPIEYTQELRQSWSAELHVGYHKGFYKTFEQKFDSELSNPSFKMFDGFKVVAKIGPRITLIPYGRKSLGSIYAGLNFFIRSEVDTDLCVRGDYGLEPYGGINFLWFNFEAKSDLYKETLFELGNCDQTEYPPDSVFRSGDLDGEWQSDDFDFDFQLTSQDSTCFIRSINENTCEMMTARVCFRENLFFLEYDKNCSEIDWGIIIIKKESIHGIKCLWNSNNYNDYIKLRRK
jgi:predicted metal-dependent hydrolase